jgi:hypothetical protein
MLSKGVENLVVEVNKKAGRLKGSTRASAVKDNTRNEECMKIDFCWSIGQPLSLANSEFSK